MLRRVIRHSRFIYAGVILQQNDQKKEEPGKSVESVKSDVRPASGAIGESVKNRVELPQRRDNDEGVSQTYKLVKEDAKLNITGWDRVKNLFKISEFKEVDPNLMFVYHFSQTGLLFGFALGGLREYIKAFNLFMISNDANMFMSFGEARAKLARVGFQAFLKGGLLTAPKFGFLVGLFLLTQTIVTEYRGKNGIIEFPIAGAVTTAVMKWNLGIRGMISGSVTGALSGLVLGPIIYFTLKLCGLTVSDTKYILHSLQKRREEMLNKMKREKADDNAKMEKFYGEKTKHLPPGLTDEI